MTITKYECTQCGKRYDSYGSARQHVDRHQTSGFWDARVRRVFVPEDAGIQQSLRSYSNDQ